MLPTNVPYSRNRRTLEKENKRVVEEIFNEIRPTYAFELLLQLFPRSSDKYQMWRSWVNASPWNDGVAIDENAAMSGFEDLFNNHVVRTRGKVYPVESHRLLVFLGDVEYSLYELRHIFLWNHSDELEQTVWNRAGIRANQAYFFDCNFDLNQIKKVVEDYFHDGPRVSSEGI